MKRLFWGTVVLILSGCGDSRVSEVVESPAPVSKPTETSTATIESTPTPLAPLTVEVKALIGTEYIYPKSQEIIAKYGSPETLEGTNNFRWIAYFPKGDFTIVTSKKDNVIQQIEAGKGLP